MGRERGKYAAILDEEMWAFIDRRDSFYPDGPPADLGASRQIYDSVCQAFLASHPDGVSVRDIEIATVPVRIYTSSGDGPARIVYLHGGSFVFGGLESHDDVCAEICARTHCDVVAVDYRLSPEYCHPAAFDDALDAYAFATAIDDRPIVLCGDSAGGNLAAAVAHARRGCAPEPIGLVLIYPGLGGDRTRGSCVDHAEAPMLTIDDVTYFEGVRTGGTCIEGNPTLAPLHDIDFSGLPPTVAITAECDPLSSDGEAYCRCLAEAGGKAVWFEEKGLVHGYLRARHSVGRAGQSFDRIVDALSSLARQEWPYAQKGAQ